MPGGIPAHAVVEPDREAVVENAVRLTYAELAARARRLARVLASKGAKPGTRAAVMLPNSADVVVAGAATEVGQLEWVPVNWHLKADEVAWILTDSGAKVLLAHERLRPYAGPAAARAGVPVVWAGTPAYERQLAAAGDAPLDGEWPGPAWVFYTSGTTGRPKGVVRDALHGEATGVLQQALCDLWGFTADDVYCLAGPAYHAGPGGYLMAMVYVGGKVVVLPDWDATAFLRAVTKERVTTTFLTPAHMIRLLEVPPAELACYDLSSLRLIIHAGAPCPLEVKRRFLALLPACDVSELYGASEGGVTRINRADWEAHPGSVGRPWPGVQVRILDTETGAPVPAGGDGVVWVKPPDGQRFQYHLDEEKTREAWRDGAFTVGDIGHVDADGWLYLTDRMNDMVLWGGVNVYPREVEEVLHGHPLVVDCAVFGIPDSRHGEVLAAVVEAREPVEPEALRGWVRARLADFKVPARVWLVEALPRDPNGKVLKRLLAKEYTSRV